MITDYTLIWALALGLFAAVTYVGLRRKTDRHDLPLGSMSEEWHRYDLARYRGDRL